jgi:unsaturated rhamnogalacturonyl hydrolase
MSTYLEPRESSRYWYGEDEQRILEVLSGRYVGANPPIPFALRAFAKSGILQNDEGLYEMNLLERLRNANIGDYSYLYGLVWSDDERSIDGLMEPFGPIQFFLNGAQLYRSTVVDELKPGASAMIPLLLQKGWNQLVIEARKTPVGFGCRFGADEAKVRILQVLAPFEGRSGSAGWVYSEPVTASKMKAEIDVFDYRSPEEKSGLTWLPQMKWSAEQERKPNCERLFGRPSAETAAYGWTVLQTPVTEGAVHLIGRAWGPTTIWLDGALALTIEEAGPFEHPISMLPAGRGEVLVHTVSSTEGWGFELNVIEEGIRLELSAPRLVHGYDKDWFFAGPLNPSLVMSPSSVCTMTAVFPAADLDAQPSGVVYWSLDAPEARVRPYYENAMLSNKWTTGSATNYGRWDYPLGVTMYGLLRTARELQRKDLLSYALSHIRSCTEMYDYSMWDKEEYGFPSINHQLVLIRMLDNCGSFGSAMLEAYAETNDFTFKRIADRIAEFMLQRLERTDKGAFYRLCEGEYSADTMWADDLYMSGPFLIRYAQVSGEQAALHEAARQFLLFKSYLYMENEGLMSHVFDFKFGYATQVPWGRGNGWCLFSLSELLEKLPEGHDDKPALIAFFQDMCKGVAALQADSGLWRQVLNRQDAYEEASCTAMFAYAFARGVRFGWLDSPTYFSGIALKAWQGLTSEAIDRQGNVYGVCSGSRYSFSPDYYMYDLRTVLNDNHGIGIMLLAGVEISRLKAERKHGYPQPLRGEAIV